MLLLKRVSEMGLYGEEGMKERNEFKTIKFNPEELIQLRDMNKKELTGLMVFCGIRVFNDVPLVVMEEEEMRTAYLGWRLLQTENLQEEISPEQKRGIKWIRILNQTTNTLRHL